MYSILDNDVENSKLFFAILKCILCQHGTRWIIKIISWNYRTFVNFCTLGGGGVGVTRSMWKYTKRDSNLSDAISSCMHDGKKKKFFYLNIIFLKNIIHKIRTKTYVFRVFCWTCRENFLNFAIQGMVKSRSIDDTVTVLHQSWLTLVDIDVKSSIRTGKPGKACQVPRVPAVPRDWHAVGGGGGSGGGQEAVTGPAQWPPVGAAGVGGRQRPPYEVGRELGGGRGEAGWPSHHVHALASHRLGGAWRLQVSLSNGLMYRRGLEDSLTFRAFHPEVGAWPSEWLQTGLHSW